MLIKFNIKIEATIYLSVYFFYIWVFVFLFLGRLQEPLIKDKTLIQ